MFILGYSKNTGCLGFWEGDYKEKVKAAQKQDKISALSKNVPELTLPISN